MSELSRLTDEHLCIDAGAPLSAELIAAVNQTCDTIENSDKDIVLIVELAGPAGAPTTDQWPHSTEIHTVNKWEQAVRRLERLPAATVAVVTGTVSGPALDVLLATDYRLSTADGVLRAPVVGRATWPGMGLYRMANQMGLNRSRQFGLLGMELSATRAMEFGLVDEIVADPAAAARAVVDSLAGVSGKELSIRRQLLAEAVSTSHENALGSHLAACDRALRVARTGVDSAA